jgi:phosphatidylglycerophosphate synthase
VALAADRLELAAAFLGAAWLTDGLDGVAARASDGPTRLGDYDLVADTAVGAGALVGLAVAGHLPAAVAAALLVVLGTGFLLLRNPALSMGLQATGYAWSLWIFWRDGAAVWLPLAIAAALGFVHHRRLFGVVIPAFLRGVASLPKLRKRSGFDLEE